VVASIADDGWAWVAPWNGVPKSKSLSDEKIDSVLMEQRELFESHGFHTRPISLSEAKKYGVNGSIANNVIFTLGL